MKTSKLLYTAFVFLILSALIGAIVLKTGALSKKPICPDCNVILVSLDTLGSNHLPCYGYERNTAPNLCKFAKDNIYFTNSYSNASWTLPSHFSIFTSLYPKHHGMLTYSKDHSGLLNRDIPMMTELLKNSGYDTVFVGVTEDNGLDLKRGLGRGFDNVIPYSNTINSWEKGYEKLLENQKNGKKTFLFLHTYMVHMPYLVGDYSDRDKRIYATGNHPEVSLTTKDLYTFTKPFYDFVLKRLSYEDSYRELARDKRIVIADKLKKASSLKEAEELFVKLLGKHDVLNYFTDYYFDVLFTNPDLASYTNDLYDELIVDLDAELAKLFEMVSKNKIGGNTIIIITSDHGEEFMEHGAITHPVDHLYNTTTSVPLIMQVPGFQQKKIDKLVEGVDLMPTILELAGIKAPDPIDGLSLVRLIEDPEAPHKKYLVSQGSNDSIREGKWKLYVDYYRDGAKNEYELYDLSKDPDESNNLADKKPEIVSNLFENLNKIIYKR